MRRRAAIRCNEARLHSLLTKEDMDEIDEAGAEYGFDQRRKESEVSRLESILDSLDRPKRKDGEK